MTIRVQGFRALVFQRAMAAVSWPGFPPQSRVIPPVVIAGWPSSGSRSPRLFQGLAWGGATLSSFLKAFVPPAAPLPPAVQVVIAPLGGTSFPSGHVLTYVVLYGFFAYLIATHARPSHASRGAIAGLLGLIALIGPSRVEEGHHWTTDVLASYLVGTAYVLILIQLPERARPR